MQPPEHSIDDLPSWMRPRRRVIDWGLLLVFAACLIVALPFVTQTGLPFHTDADLWVARSLQITDVMHSGTLYTRWAPDFNAGLGSPLFNYLAPLPHYLSGLHQLITDADPTDSFKILTVLSIIAAGCGMYLFARQRWTPTVGILCALFYLFSPPIALVLPHQMGDLASLLSLGLLPCALWSLDRFVRHSTRFTFVSATLLLVAWSLSDVRLTLLGLPMLAVVLLSHWKARWVWWILFLVLLIAAFFWLPAILEHDQVTWLSLFEQPATPIRPFDFVSLPDPKLLNPPPYAGLGVALGIGALLSLIVNVRQTRHLTADRIVFALLAFGYLVAASVRTAEPGWQMIQPYHILLGGLFSLALLAGQIGDAIERLSVPRSRALLFGAVCLLIILATVLPLYESRWIIVPATKQTILFDQLDGLLLPLSASPSSLSTLVVNSAQNATRLDPSPNLGILQIERMPLASRYTADLERAVSIKFDRLAFPGWFVSIDGVQNTADATAQGLVSYTLPQNAREVVVWFGSTQLRSLGWLLSGFGLLLLLWRLRRLNAAPIVQQAMLERPQMITLAAVLTISVMVGAALWFGRPSLLPVSSEALTPLNIKFKDIPIELSAFHIEDTQPGQPIRARLYWQTAQSLSADYNLQIRLVREGDQQVVSEVTHWYAGGIPSHLWPPGSTVREEVSLAAPAQPGMYHLEIRLGQCRQTVWCEKPQIIPGGINGKDEEIIALPGSIRAGGLP